MQKSKLTTNQKRRLARAIGRAASAELAARQAQLRLIRAERRVAAEEFERLKNIAIVVSLPLSLLLCIVLSCIWFMIVANLLKISHVTIP